MPAAQSRHADAADKEEYVPAPHAAQSVCAVAPGPPENVPAPHAVQAVDRASAYRPGPHAAHPPPAASTKRPTPQSWHCDGLWVPLPATYLPAGQWAHADADWVEEYVPEPHGAHVLAPAAAE